ncbi:hypothetical protein [Streptomyces sp. WAC 06738]|uniref:hypothetical protein n=1 Tax=Streptomyces sp. WAC 06738 TaxID=2203210 RepID=UPI001F0B8247|nr:hypothetical protein [Streptomyces sp. WAC 06738]
MGRGFGFLAAVCAGAVLLAGCGEESGSGTGTGMPSGGGSPSTAEEYAEATRQEHDRAWPGIARKCRDVRPEPTAAAEGEGEGGVPENPKYGENNAYKQTTDVTPDELCRGEAHAARIAAALEDAAPAGPKDERQIRRVLEDLGYATDTVTARQAGASAVAWDVMVAGAGPCISGNTDWPGEIDVHGVYMEGGCTEPVGGH